MKNMKTVIGAALEAYITNKEISIVELDGMLSDLNTDNLSEIYIVIQKGTSSCQPYPRIFFKQFRSEKFTHGSCIITPEVRHDGVDFVNFGIVFTLPILSTTLRGKMYVENSTDPFYGSGDIDAFAKLELNKLLNNLVQLENLKPHLNIG